VRILYGVAGEGMGHATRSHAFLADLVGDHDVLIVASGRAATTWHSTSLRCARSLDPLWPTKTTRSVDGKGAQ